MPSPDTQQRWGIPPWQIDFTPSREPIPQAADVAIVGGGFAGLAAAAWLRLLAPERSVVVLEAGRVGAGASGRTGGIVLAGTAADDPPGLGDVLAGVRGILEKLEAACGFSLAASCELRLDGAWEIGRTAALARSAIAWNDSGALRVVNEVPGGTLDPGKLVSGLARAGQQLGAVVLENQPVARVHWSGRAELELGHSRSGKISAGKILFATNALSLSLTGLSSQTHPRLTLAAATEPLREEQLEAVGLGQRKPFYTVDLPYLWGRVRRDNSIVWGAGLVDAPDSDGLEKIDVASEEPSRMFAALEKRVRNLHPALEAVRFTHRWGGPILFREGWQPVLDWHPESRTGIVLGAYAGHGVALSVYLGAWAAEVLLGRRDLPPWGSVSR